MIVFDICRWGWGLLKMEFVIIFMGLYFSGKELFVQPSLQLTLSIGPVHNNTPGHKHVVQYVRKSMGTFVIEDAFASYTLDLGSMFAFPTINSFGITVFPIMYNGEPLFGWFHVRLTKIPSIDMRWLIMESNLFEPGSDHEVVTVLGEFVNPDFFEGTTCATATLQSVPEIRKANLFPSFYAHNPNPFVGVGVGYRTGAASSFSSAEEIRVNWKMNLPPCVPTHSTQNKLHFRGMMAHTKSEMENDTATAGGTWAPSIFFKDYVYGAHDPVPPKNAAVTCDIGTDLGNNQSSRIVPDWIEHVIPVSNVNEYITSPNGTCSLNIPDDGTQLLYGRCRYDKSRKKMELDKVTQFSCDSPASEPNPFYEQLPPMSEYISQMVKENEILCQECSNIVARSISSALRAQNITFPKGEAISSEIGKHIWSLRQGHGAFAVLVTMFLFPVSNFVTRYFKETFLDIKLINMHVWYTIHIMGGVLVFCGLIASLTVAVFARAYLGYSRHSIARYHTLLGWWAVIVFTLTFISSGFRRYGTVIERNVTVGLHFLGGMGFYVLCILCLLLSCYVPASPSAYHDSHVVGFKKEHLGLVFGGWTLFDIFMNCYMTNLLKRGDLRMGLDRERVWAMGMVPLPVVGIYAEKDLHGGDRRKLLLLLYTIVSATSTLAVWLLITYNPPINRRFGAMVLTHSEEFEPVPVYNLFYSELV